ncbi:hypothetical protein [Teredinibacter turnerae]|uniref:hypothetical protein n=1 Tax=Teredinibacter turnerae TaxID=2426 RepID=UPI0003F8CE30|nr:hypothetical protein [Teredinibacter turnerae]
MLPKTYLIGVAFGVIAVTAESATVCDTVDNDSDPFDVGTYSACGASSSDLSGVWMIVSDYNLETSYFGMTWNESRRQRQTVQILDNQDGTITVSDCGFLGYGYEYTLSTSANELKLVGDQVVDFSLEIVNNTQLSGSVVSRASVWGTSIDVISNYAEATKLRDLTAPVVTLGDLSSEYGPVDKKKMLNNWQIACFKNTAYDIEYTYLDGSTERRVYENTDLYAAESVENGIAGDALALFSISEPTLNEELRAEFNLAERNDVNGEADNVNIDYVEDANNHLSGGASIQDEDRALVSADIKFNFSL